MQSDTLRQVPFPVRFPIPLPLASACAVAFAALAAPAQSHGEWVAAFDHQHAVPGVATNAQSPFTSAQAPRWPARLWAPDQTTPPVAVPTLNAIHMSLIPVGPHRGKVVVWDRGPLIGSAAPFDAALWNFQAWSVVDPEPAPAGPRFRNFFLPLDRLVGPYATDFFCAGHAWSPFGYLVVAGGTRYVGGTDNGADLVYTFDPRFPNAGFPGSGGAALYEDAGGRWTRESFTLNSSRYYPTVTLTHRLPRQYQNLPPLVETMLVLGGSQVGSRFCPEWNTYEALVLTDVDAGQRVWRDTVDGHSTWWGPGTGGGEPLDDWLLEYPRTHLLGNGLVFLAGDAPQSSQVDHSFAPGTLTPAPWTPTGTWTQRWIRGAGNPGPASRYRHSSSSVLFVNGLGIADLVVRIGGDTPQGTTNTVEACSASVPSTWTSAPQVPSLEYPREHANAVILPDASIFVVGGHDGTDSMVIPELFRWGSGTWAKQSPARTKRNYHATAVLLPDGRVLVGGGNDRHDTPGGTGTDYEIFAPHYLTGNPPPVRPQGVTIQNATAIDDDGTFVLARRGGYQLTVDDMPIDSRLAKLVLISPGSVTHHSDMHQRYVECRTIALEQCLLEFATPSETQAPRGYYMAFAVTSGGIPAEAIWVRLQ